MDNEYVEGVLEMIQIFKTGILPENPNVCFIEAIKDQIPDDIVEKINMISDQNMFQLPPSRKCVSRTISSSR